MHLADHRESLVRRSMSKMLIPHPSVRQCLTHVHSGFQVPEGNVVTLSFRIFDLEADSQCRYDYLDVYNGHSNLVQKLGRFCGTFRPGSLISTTNTMMLEMVSDAETQGRGFVAYFSGTRPYVDGKCMVTFKSFLFVLLYMPA